MTPDALRGRGAYRCGCGVRVKVETLPTEAAQGCTVQPCRNVVVASSGMSRMCREHDKEHLLEMLPRVMRDHPPHTWHGLLEEYEARFGRIDNEAERRMTMDLIALSMDKRPLGEPVNAVVYFLRVGDKVKIGTTVRLKSRLHGLNPAPGSSVVLTLPGSYELEAEIHEQFRDERNGGSEWFDLTPRLEQFIASRAPATPIWTRSPTSTASRRRTRSA